jgi:threonylcarbamoyladenosine tRNA methylthiotransferase CDKAL1
MSSVNGNYFVFANSGGCPQNQLDASRLFAYLNGNGYIHAKSPRDADLIFINGCSYRSEKEDESFHAIADLESIAKPGARIFITGCLPKIAPDRVAVLDKKYTVIPGVDLHRIEEWVAPVRVGWHECRANRIPPELFNYQKPFRRYLARGIGFFRNRLQRKIRRHFDALFMYDHSDKSYIVRISEGCLGQCSYCAIRFSRGRLKSREKAAILSEVRVGIQQGCDEILLTATELAGYGRDQGTDFADLLNEILHVPGDFDLLLFYANPRWLIDRWNQLEPIFASGRIHFIHLSLNGVSDDVLRRMARGYTLREFETLVRAIRKVSPGTILQTQVIVGFPGETEDDFNTARTFFRENFIHNVQVHAYDARPGTAAALMTDQVLKQERQRRRRILYRQTCLAKIRFNLLYPLHQLFPLNRSSS